MLSKNYVGIDYHLNSIQVCVLSSDGKKLGNKKCKNDTLEVIEYISKFGDVEQGAVEVSCGAASFVEDIKSLAGWHFELCHPGYVNRMKHNPDKSDKSDAELIADLVRVGYLPKVWLCPENIRELRQVVRFRFQRVSEAKRIKVRIRAILRNLRIKTPPKFSLNKIWCLNWLEEKSKELPSQSQWVLQEQLSALEFVKKQISKTEQRLIAWSAEDNLTQKLLSMKGVGLVGATVIRAEVCTTTRFSRSKEFARFCGFSPRNCSSGERQADSGLIKVGNTELKRVIVQIAQIKCRTEPKWREFADRLNKPFCVRVVAVANRWLRSLFHELREFELA